MSGATNADELYRVRRTPAELDQAKADWEKQREFYVRRNAAHERASRDHRLTVTSPHLARCACGWTGPEINFTAHLEEAVRGMSQAEP